MDARDQTRVEVDAVLLDMDGTLVDSTALVETLWADFSARHRLALADVLAYAHGRPTRDTVRRFLPPTADLDAVVASFQATEVARTEGIVEVPGAAALLTALRGARTAVVTSASRPLALRRLAAAGLPVPDVVVTADDVTAGKPDPAGYRQAARLLGTVPERCLVLEDAEAGVLAARAAGARTLVVGPYTSPTTHGLDRVPDLRAVHAEVCASGARARVRWPR